MNKVELRAALLATSSAAALIIGFVQSAEAAACSATNQSPPINNTGSINCITFNNEQGGTPNGNFSGSANYTGNVTNSGTLTPTGVNQNSPAGVAGTDAGISVLGPGVTLTGSITNAGTITGANAQFAGINIGGGGGGSGAPGSTITGSIINAAGATITGIHTLMEISGIGTVVQGSMINAAGATLTNSAAFTNSAMVVQGRASLAGSLVNNGTITSGGSGLLESSATIGGNMSNSGTITSAGFDVIGANNANGVIGGSIINSGTLVDTNTGTAGNIVIYTNDALIGGSVINTGTGTLTGGLGIAITGSTSAGTIASVTGSVVNAGVISANIKDGIDIANATIGGSVSNSGSISAARGGIRLLNSDGAVGGASIAGGITNSGMVTSSSAISGAIAIIGGTVVGGITNAANGTLAASGGVGIFLTTQTGTHQSTQKANVSAGIMNAGLITAKTGIKIAGGSTLTGGISNSGNITGSTAAIDVTGEAAATTITHSAGTISGNILLSNKGDTVNQTGGTIIGNIIGQGGGSAINFSLGAGSQTFGPGTNITNVGVITVNSGTLILNGTGNSDFATRINGGTLIVGDATHSTAIFTDPPSGGVTVAGGGMLAGYGTIVGNVTNTGGLVAGGGTFLNPGKLRITGNYTQGAGGTYVVEVNPTTASKLAVSGTASLAGNVKVVFDPGSYSAITYNVLHATAVNGSFSSAITATNAPSGITSSLNQTATDVNLALTGSGSNNSNNNSNAGTVTTPTGVLGTSSNIALGSALGSSDQIFDHLDEVGQGSDSVKTALAAHAPMQIAMNGTLGQVAQLGSSMPNMMAQFGGWVRGIGQFQSADSQGAVPGYSASGGGFLAGIDHAFGPLTAGVAGGYSGANFKQNDGSTGDIETPRVMAYARFHATSQFIVDGVAGFAYDSIHTSRPVAALGTNAVESHSGTEGSLALQAGYELPWQGFTVIPRMGAQYLHLSQRGFTESGASGFNLTAPSSHIDSFQPIFSVAALRAFALDSGMHVTPEVKVAYSHEMLNTSQILALTTPAGSVVTGTALSPARDTVTVGPQVTLQMTDQLSVYADYKAVIGVGESLANVIFAGARFDW